MKTVLIAGAGIIGLATALELAESGIEVTVLERGEAMQEASWAAAGMLAARDPENPPELAAFAQWGLSLYPDFLRRVERLSGRRVPWRTTHTLQICPPGSSTVPDQVRDGAKVLTPAEARNLVPDLGDTAGKRLLWLEERSLDPRDLCLALPAAVRTASVRIVEHCAADTFSASLKAGHRGVTVMAGVDEHCADALVLCCGAWSSALYPRLATVPRKGQMLAVRMPADGRRLTTVLRAQDVYLVPRGSDGESGEDDARIIVGATIEDAGFDRTIRAAATSWLLQKAAALWPPIRSAKVENAWTGIRPGTPDGLPIIGPLPAAAPHQEHLWVATGHFRNGILLAPGTARAVATALLGETVGASGHPFDLTPFHPSRFVQTVNLEHEERERDAWVMGSASH